MGPQLAVGHFVGHFNLRASLCGSFRGSLILASFRLSLFCRASCPTPAQSPRLLLRGPPREIALDRGRRTCIIHTSCGALSRLVPSLPVSALRKPSEIAISGTFRARKHMEASDARVCVLRFAPLCLNLFGRALCLLFLDVGVACWMVA